MFKKTMVRGLLAVALVATAVSAQAGTINVFNMPSGQTSLSFVTVGDPGNLPDPATGNLYGSVPYTFQMDAYDVTVAQYVQFLNAVAKTDTYGLYDSKMATGYTSVGISQSGVSGSYGYAVTGTAPGANNMPVFDVTWGDAARFCNWLQNGQPTGAEDNGTTETGTYALNGGTSNAALLAVTRNANATYFIPSENEWYKAAYYIGGGTNAGYWTYPTRSNSAPSNVLSPTGTNNANIGLSDPTTDLTPVGSYTDSPGPYGTYDMGGDVGQWTESYYNDEWDGLGPSRIYRGGYWDSNSSYLASSDTRGDDEPASYYDIMGFRVASVATVPEPGTLTLSLIGVVALGIWSLRRNALRLSRFFSDDARRAPLPTPQSRPQSASV
jgi:formylglycine-generating enzyme required for sulfatase activity